MPKFNIPDLTVLMSVRLDSIDRLENILAVTKYIVSNFEIKIHVLECAHTNNGILKRLLDRKIEYFFFESNDPILYRTRLINRMIENVKTHYISNWDSDAIVPIGQFIEAIKLLQNNEASFVYPYERLCLDTTYILRGLFFDERKSLVLEENKNKMREIYMPDPVGGIFLANLEKYKESGCENEDFYGWGMEDGERYYRWINLGYKVKRVTGPLFHLSHIRGINSNFHNGDQKFFKEKEVMLLKRKGLT